ncbi:hypothetical protein CDL12_09140 [Handroanthus impetiginosus]|uniref:Uncharacterized protein n=1 Tax=Handroanthus impetiginosus TaxID=429701 RepID=A0A2G9HKZ3_9LAMI|nr:hypothetical protein CDL12_09140 [Handroanthus impetiginosus]
MRERVVDSEDLTSRNAQSNLNVHQGSEHIERSRARNDPVISKNVHQRSGHMKRSQAKNNLVVPKNKHVLSKAEINEISYEATRPGEKLNKRNTTLS